MRTNASPHQTLVRTTMNKMDEYYRLMPSKLRMYLLYDAIGPFDAQEAYQLYQMLGKNVDATIAEIKRVERNITRNTYGKDYPL